MSAPFILKFAEHPKEAIIDTGLVEYSEELNLNVIKGTSIPAIKYSSLGTETFTKTQGEGADSDRNDDIQLLADTFTETRVVTETSDSDLSSFYLQKLVDTSTLTEVKVEGTDADPT